MCWKFDKYRLGELIVLCWNCEMTLIYSQIRAIIYSHTILSQIVPFFSLHDFEKLVKAIMEDKYSKHLALDSIYCQLFPFWLLWAIFYLTESRINWKKTIGLIKYPRLARNYWYFFLKKSFSPIFWTNHPIHLGNWFFKARSLTILMRIFTLRNAIIFQVMALITKGYRTQNSFHWINLIVVEETSDILPKIFLGFLFL